MVNENTPSSTSQPTAVAVPRQLLQSLRIQSKHLDPLVRIGKAGLSEGAVLYIKTMLKAKGLVKFKVLNNATDNSSIDDIIAEAASKCQAVLVDRIGLTFTLYYPFSRTKFK